MKWVFVSAQSMIGLKGGAEYQIHMISKNLVERGHKVSVLTESKAHVSKIIDGVTYDGVLLPKRRGLEFLNYFRLKNYIEMHKPDIIYNRVLTPYTGLTCFIARHKKIKFIYHLSSDREADKLDTNPLHYLNFRMFDNLFKTYGLRNSTYRISQTLYQKENLQRNLNLSSHVISNGHEVPSKRFIKDKTINVLWVANIKRSKRIELFLKLASLFQNKDYNFYCIGSFQERGRLYEYQVRNICERLPNVKYLGYLSLDNVNQLFEKSHILVHTGNLEGFPNTFIQAWMRKMVVLSLNIDPDNVLTSKKIGFLGKNFDNFVQQFQYLVSNPKALIEFGIKSRKHALENHNIKNKCDEILEIIK